ncbi:hypothetical protein F383_03387 [Gossypium arboreum]|uniref:Uncharacterized protein n=1 Tax=Gossypium arboreum TaxID=29729 RepID=A0A0B0NTJ2_GOSAR|nr:hypothetical protein F383_03387 [Gossypium arboreum]
MSLLLVDSRTAGCLLPLSCPISSDDSCFISCFACYPIHFFLLTTNFSLGLFSIIPPDSNEKGIPIIVTEGRSIAIPSFNTCRPAKAPAANGDGTFVCSTVVVARSFPDRP